MGGPAADLPSQLSEDGEPGEVSGDTSDGGVTVGLRRASSEAVGNGIEGIVDATGFVRGRDLSSTAC